MNYHPFKKKALALAVSSATVLTGGMSSQALAQVEQIEEVTVTGSRIKRQDFISNSPVATVDAEQFKLTGTVNTESLLNTLPQVVPGLDRTSNNPGNGTASVDLRGLGESRTLVLINGRRASPTNQGGTVDINTIPTALIKNVEVVTGGASAVYGSDAIAGVVNFTLDDEFQGIQTGAGYEITEEGDAGIFNADFTWGGGFANDRGHVVVNVSVADRDALFQGDRDFSTFAQFESTDDAGNPILINGGSSGVPGTSIFAGGFGFSPSFGIIFEPDGSLRNFETTGDDNDFYNYAPDNFIQLPQERIQATILSKFELTENIEAYSEILYTNSQVPQQLAPSPAFQNVTFTVDGNPFITPEAQVILSNGIGDGVDANGNGIADTATALVRRRLEEVGPRFADDEFETISLTSGLRGDIGASAWSYDAYITIGESTGESTLLGDVSSTRFAQSLLLGPDGGCLDPSGGCVPTNIFGEGNISAESVAFLSTFIESEQTFDQVIAAANFTGKVGIVGLAAGLEYRDQEFDFSPNAALAAGDLVGFNSAPASGGSVDVTEFYAEALIPILSGRVGAERLEVELAARVSDYSTIGSVETFKAAGSWAITDKFRFRGGANLAIRAPGIGELFAPQGENFPGAIDPCSAEGAPDAATVAICAATGVPANVIGTPAINSPAGQVRSLVGGNPDLIEEEATTLTFGFVANILPSLTVSVDYFDIEIDDFVAAFGGTAANVLGICFDPTDPAGGVGSDFCNVIDRLPGGQIDSVTLSAQNVAQQTLAGFDIAASYGTQLGSGNFSVRYLGTITEEREFTAFDGAEPFDCAGRFGDALCDEPLPEYRHRITVGWAGEKISGQLLWRHIGSSEDDNDDVVFFVEDLDSENYIDVSGEYRFNDNFSLNFGVDNLFDQQPPILGGNAEQSNTFPATFDVFGRTYYAKFNARF